MSLILAMILTGNVLLASEGDLEKGKEMFKMRCASCHHPINKAVGPALHNVQERHSVDWILSFVRSSQTMIKNGDAEAIAVFNENNQGIMPDHPDITKEDVENMIAFINAEAEVLIAEKDNTGIQRPKEEAKAGFRPMVFSKDYWKFLIFGGLLFIFFLVMNTIVNNVSILRKLKHKDTPSNDMEP